MSEQSTKQCPYCAETIKVAAVICRFCNRPLHSSPSSPSSPSSQLSATMALLNEKRSKGEISQNEYHEMAKSISEKHGVQYTSPSDSKWYKTEVNAKSVSQGVSAIVILIVGYFVLFAESSTESVNSSQSQSGTRIKVQQLKASVERNCVEYKAAPNEIKKSRVFRKNEAELSKVLIANEKGILKSISTDQGGSKVEIYIEVGDVGFTNSGIMSGAKRGSKVYNQVENLREGQCVVFSASEIEASSILEKSQVCDLDYRAKFIDVKPCQ